MMSFSDLYPTILCDSENYVYQLLKTKHEKCGPHIAHKLTKYIYPKENLFWYIYFDSVFTDMYSKCNNDSNSTLAI